jgi:hypothetical protein
VHSFVVSCDSCHLSMLSSALTPQNFYPGATTVTIGSQSCSNVVVTDTSGLGTLQCTAPPGPGFGDVQLRVSVVGGGNASTPFLYTAPAITGLSVVACAAETNEPIRLTGTNFGLTNGTTSPEPVVYIGNKSCTELRLVTPTQIQCTAVAAEVGAYPVVGKSWVAVC